MRVLGIDPGLDATGYGIVEGGNGSGARLIEAGLIRTSKSQPLPRRLLAVSEQLRAVIDQHRPELVAVEDLYSYYKTPQPAILMGHVRGVVLGTAASAGLSVVSYLPTRIKRTIAGQGHASKHQIARLVQSRLNLPHSDVPPDVTDALAVALCHMDRARKP